MPELPEVEIRRQYLETSSLYQPVSHIEVEDKKLLTTDLATLQQALIGRQFTGTRRVGKICSFLPMRPMSLSICTLA